MSDLDERLAAGWDEVHPDAQRCYSREIESYIQAAKETAAEWDRSKDPHGYCHERSTLVRLVQEIERLRGPIASSSATTQPFSGP